MPKAIDIKELESKLETAQKNYLAKDYELSLESYSGILEEQEHTNPYIIVNKAVSEFKNGHYGAALVDMYRAKKIIPRDKKLNTNIELVQEELGLNQPNLTFLNYFTLNEVLILLFITNLIFVFRWRLVKVATMRFIVSFIFTLTLAFSAYCFINQKVLDYGVIQTSSAKVYSGNNDSFSKIGELLEGQVIRVKSLEENWVQISFNDDLGWIQEDNLAYF